jgi:hypothetical protein
VAVEATDPDTRPATRRKTDGTCDDSLASEAAFAMAQRAYELLPHCNALSLEQYRNAAPLLSFCALLEGDRLAAAEAMNQSGKIDRIFGDPRPEELTSLVCAEATLQWPGEAPARGSEGAAEYRKRHQSEIWGTHIARVIGENVNRVRITGRLSKRLKDSESIETAPFEQIWMREDRNFCLREMRVEPFAPAAAK